MKMNSEEDQIYLTFTQQMKWTLNEIKQIYLFKRTSYYLGRVQKKLLSISYFWLTYCWLQSSTIATYILVTVIHGPLTVTNRGPYSHDVFTLRILLKGYNDSVNKIVWSPTCSFVRDE